MRGFSPFGEKYMQCESQFTEHTIIPLPPPKSTPVIKHKLIIRGRAGGKGLFPIWLNNKNMQCESQFTEYTIIPLPPPESMPVIKHKLIIRGRAGGEGHFSIS